MKNNHRSGSLDVSALHLLHRAGQCAEVLFTNETGKADLTPRQYAILASVSQNPDVSQTGPVEQTGVDRSTLADIVRRLVKKGLLQRKRTRRDARMYAVRLTQKGQAALNAVKPAAARVDQRLLSVLGANERGTFIGALGEIVRAMNSQARPGAEPRTAYPSGDPARSRRLALPIGVCRGRSRPRKRARASKHPKGTASPAGTKQRRIRSPTRAARQR